MTARGDDGGGPGPAPAAGLGLRWSFARELADRLEAGTAAVGCVEIVPENYMLRHDGIRDAMARVAAHTRVLTHGLSANLAGTDPLDEAYLRTLRAFLDEVGAAFHTDHLCVTAHRGACLHDLLPPIATPREVRRVADRIRAVQDRLGRPLAVENVTTYVWPDDAMDPFEYVAQVVEAADCGLLLDLHNVYVMAENAGIDPAGALDRLPLARVAYVHVAGGAYWNDLGTWVDTHGADVPDPVYGLLAVLFDRIDPVPVVYERDSRMPPLDEILHTCTRLSQHLDGIVRKRRGRADPRTASRPAPDAEHVRTAGTPPPARGRSTHARVPATADAETLERLDALVRAVRRVHEDRAEADLARFLGAPPAGRRRRLAVYRRLVRGTFGSVLAALLPEARAARTPPAFDEDVACFLERASTIPWSLRAVPAAFVEYCATARWDDAPAVRAAAALDLAVAEAAVAPRGPPPEISLSPALAPDRPVVTCRSLRLAAGASSGAPPPQAVYRDAADRVRRIECSRRAFRLLADLAAGRSLLEAAPAWGRTPADLADLETFLRDMAARGVLLGTAAPRANR